MKKVLFISNVLSMITHFNSNNIKILQNMGCEVHVACNLNDYSIMTEKTVNNLIEKYTNKGVIFHQVDFKRNFKSYKTIVSSYKQIKKIFEENKFEFVHCHSQIAGLCGRIAAYKKKVKTVYTAHGFMFFKGGPLLNWILFYPQEWICSWFTDILITINTEDYQLAKKYFHAKKVMYVPGVGIDREKFHRKSTDIKREKIGINKNEIILLSVGELNPNKSHSSVIKALGEIKNINVHYCIAGTGVSRRSLIKLTEEVGVTPQVHLLGYQDNITELMQVADIYILPSLREGLNVSLMEAMASGLPCIVRDIRGNRDLIENEKGGFLFQKDEQLPKMIDKLVSDSKFRESAGEYNHIKIKEFSIDKVNEKMEKIYKGL